MDVFGGGLGARGEVCGILIGALAALSLRWGRGRRDEDFDNAVWVQASKLFSYFQNDLAKGMIHCRDIAGVDWRDTQQIETFYNSGRRDHCRDLVGLTAQRLGELLDES